MASRMSATFSVRRAVNGPLRGAGQAGGGPGGCVRPGADMGAAARQMGLPDRWIPKWHDHPAGRARRLHGVLPRHRPANPADRQQPDRAVVTITRWKAAPR